MPQREENGGFKLNRTKFHGALQATLEDWIVKLRAGDTDLRDKTRNRMNQILGSHAP
jgi:hypothetical protein